MSFATQAFLAFAQSAVSPAPEANLIIGSGSESFPVYLVAPSSPSIAPTQKALITPICLSGPDRISPALLDQLPKGIAAGFIQSRCPLDQAESIFIEHNTWLIYQDGRTNYRLPLKLSDDDWLSRMKRDSRSRMRKHMAKREGLALRAIQPEGSAFERFVSLYQAIAEHQGFPDAYRFSHDQWQQLLQQAPEHHQLLGLFEEETQIAGCLITHTPSSHDYTFMAHDPDYPDGGRRLLLALMDSPLLTKPFLDLGGGISEEDPLARYKLGLGAEPVAFTRYRFVDRSQCSLSDSELRLALSQRWP